MKTLNKSLFVLLIFIPSLSLSDTFYFSTKVIEDRGGVDITKYKRSVKSTSKKRPLKIPKGDGFIEIYFPVSTSKMMPGPITPSDGSKAVITHVLEPMFIIGNDPLSKQWLKENYPELIKTKAIGMVVNVKNVVELKELSSITGHKIPLQPVSGDAISEALNIKHFPIVIEKGRVYQ